ncbi:MAG: D-arabinono-1,4-lactone oxidase, partial [Actinomycetes bacterium]
MKNSGVGDEVVLWSNWAGNQRCLVPVARPTSEPELQRLVANAAERGGTVKGVGSGHSFTGVAVATDLAVSFVDYGRVRSFDQSACTVTVEAGCRLRDLSEVLWMRGMALENLGDIDVQTVAGAISTGTHGTGLEFGNLSTSVVALRLVDGHGDVVECSPTQLPEVFRSARVGVGAVGMISTVTLQCVPAFHLYAVEEPMPIDDVLDGFDELVAANEHFECFWIPGTRWALTKRNRRNHDPVAPRSRVAAWRSDVLWDNAAFGLAQRAGSLRARWFAPVARRIPSATRVTYNDRSYRVLASPRHVRFLESEWAVPIDATVEVVQRLRRLVGDLGYPVTFPVEVRTTRADDIPLSPCFGRPTGWVSVHMYRGMPHDDYFRKVAALMADFDARPHWGKLHPMDAAGLSRRYPDWEAFQTVRRRLDPTGTFLNAELRRVLGP